jgi:hypothetical protein
MQAAAELTNVEPDYKLSAAKDRWRSAALSAARYAEDLMNLGAHKQIVNRILEPYLHISVLVTATEYANFFGLRLDAAAQPEMRELAEAMWAAWNESVTLRLEPGQWHLPYIGRGDEAWLQRTFNTTVKDDYDIGLIRKVSLARCARVSYQSFETGRRSEMEEDLALGERLLASKHLSPLEHQATPDELDEAGEYRDPGAWGNLVGWRQYRKMITGEAVAPLPEPYSWKDRDHDPV